MNAALAELLHNPLLWRGDQLAPTDWRGFQRLPRPRPGVAGRRVASRWPDRIAGRRRRHRRIAPGAACACTSACKAAHGSRWWRLRTFPMRRRSPRRGIDPGRGDRHRHGPRKGSAGGRPSRCCVPTAPARCCSGRTSSAISACTGCSSRRRTARPRRSCLPVPRAPRTRRRHRCASGSRRKQTQLRVDVFKRRGGVMSRPLLLDVRATTVHTTSCMPR